MGTDESLPASNRTDAFIRTTRKPSARPRYGPPCVLTAAPLESGAHAQPNGPASPAHVRSAGSKSAEDDWS